MFSVQCDCDSSLHVGRTLPLWHAGKYSGIPACSWTCCCSPCSHCSWIGHIHRMPSCKTTEDSRPCTLLQPEELISIKIAMISMLFLHINIHNTHTCNHLSSFSNVAMTVIPLVSCIPAQICLAGRQCHNPSYLQTGFHCQDILHT